MLCLILSLTACAINKSKFETATRKEAEAVQAEKKLELVDAALLTQIRLKKLPAYCYSRVKAGVTAADKQDANVVAVKLASALSKANDQKALCIKPYEAVSRDLAALIKKAKQ